MHGHESWELDELIVTAVLLCFLSTIFAIRRIWDFSREIKKRVGIESELLQQKSKWQSIVNSSPDFIILLDTKGHIQYVNRAISPNTPESLMGKEISSLLSPKDAATMKSALTKARKTGKPTTHLATYSTPTHADFYFEALIVPRKENDKFAGYSITSRNITDRKLAVEELRHHRDNLDELVKERTNELSQANHKLLKEIIDRTAIQNEIKKSEARYRDLFETMRDGIGLVDENETIIFCNPAYAYIFEENSNIQMKGKNLKDYLPEDELKRVNSETSKRKRGINSKYEVDIITAKGNRKTLLVSVTPKFQGDKFIGSFGAITDLTETKRHQELTQRAQRLETAGRIAGQVAHDFNNLLGPIVAYPELIKMDLPPGHPAINYLTDIERSALQIAEINNQLLTLGRRGHYNQKVILLNEVVETSISQLRDIPEGIQIEIKAAKDLLNVVGGPSQISRVLMNLIVNAIDAMSDSGKIIIKTENCYLDDSSGLFGSVPRGEYVKLTVSDNGEGIPADVLPRILDPFFSTKLTDKKRGSGLGLSVVHAVIQDHHGYLDIKTTQGEGTSFYLYFPSSREKLEETISEDIIGGTESILIVDDDMIQRDVTLQLLTNLGYDADTAGSGEEALEILKNNQKDLVILDMIMPEGIDGAETYLKIKEINPTQRSILISGYAETERVKMALEAGAGSFVKKPLTLRFLSLAVRAELDRSFAELPVT